MMMMMTIFVLRFAELRGEDEFVCLHAAWPLSVLVYIGIYRLAVLNGHCKGSTGFL